MALIHIYVLIPVIVGTVIRIVLVCVYEFFFSQVRDEEVLSRIVVCGCMRGLHTLRCKEEE